MIHSVNDYVLKKKKILAKPQRVNILSWTETNHGRYTADIICMSKTCQPQSSIHRASNGRIASNLSFLTKKFFFKFSSVDLVNTKLPLSLPITPTSINIPIKWLSYSCFDGKLI